MSTPLSALRGIERARRRAIGRIRTRGRLTLAKNAVIGGTPRIVRGAQLHIGVGSGLGIGCLCMARVVIGEDCLVSADVRFVGDDHPIHGLGRIKDSPSRFPANIDVGDDVLIGAGALIIGPARIGDGAVVAAGAVVKGDVAPLQIVAGIPARPVGSRSQR